MGPIEKVLVIIYFLGIAAVVNNPPENRVPKSVIFPAATSNTKYGVVTLAAHETWLSVTNLQNPATDCAKLTGGTIVNDACTAKLTGAKLWVLSSEPLEEDTYSRKIPSFLDYNAAAKDLQPNYTAVDPNPQYVAARFDITGGTMSACNRDKAFVSILQTNTSDASLYVRQLGRTVRLPLLNDAKIAIENRPVVPMMPDMMNGEHYGWYYYIDNKQAAPSTSLKVPKLPVSGVVECPAIPGASRGVGSAECGVTNYP